MWSLWAMVIGFGLDLLLGDPQGWPHPVAAIGRLIAALERGLRRIFPATPGGERAAGGVLWLLTVLTAAGVPALALWLCHRVSPWLRLAAESVMCWQILAVKSLRVESMKVHDALAAEDVEGARRAVSMIVGRDTRRLDRAGICRAAVETVAENTSDGVVAPLSALLMLAAGGLLGMDVGRGWRIFRRDRYRHASPNSAQTESVCAGLLGLELAGDAWYHGVLHRKPAIGDPVRAVERADIPRACRLLYVTAALALAVCALARWAAVRCLL